MNKRIFNPDNIKQIGTYADNIPKVLVSYAPGIHNRPTVFAVDDKDGKIYAFVDKKGEFYGNELGDTPTLGDEWLYIIKHGQDVTQQVRTLVAVSNFHMVQSK